MLKFNDVKKGVVFESSKDDGLKIAGSAGIDLSGPKIDELPISDVDVDGGVLVSESDTNKELQEQMEFLAEIRDLLPELEAQLDDKNTDYGNATRFSEIVEEKVKFIKDRKLWVAWSGKRWILDDHAANREYPAVYNAIQKDRNYIQGLLEDVMIVVQCLSDRMAVCTNIIADIDRLLKKEKREATADEEKTLSTQMSLSASLKMTIGMALGLAKRLEVMAKDLKLWYRSTRSERNRNASMKMSADNETIGCFGRDFDSDGMLFGLANGVYDFRLGELIKPTPSMMNLKSSPAMYVKGAKCPVWEKTLLEILSGDEELLRLFQMIAGSGMLGVTKKHMFIFTGDGKNGKSTFSQVLKMLFGKAADNQEHDGYFSTLDSSVVMADASNNNRQYELAAVSTVRTLIINELTKADLFGAAVLHDKIVKDLVDSEEGMSMRFPHGKPFKIEPMFTVILQTNYLPKLLATEYAIRRRLVLVRFKEIFSGDRDGGKQLKDAIRAEMSGVLNWCIEGAEMFLENDNEFNIPEHIAQDTKDWIDSENKLLIFIKEQCTVSPKLSQKKVDLFDAWEEWCEDTGLHSGSEPLFKKMLEAEGYELHKHSRGGVLIVKGLKLTEDMTANEALEEQNRLQELSKQQNSDTDSQSSSSMAEDFKNKKKRLDMEKLQKAWGKD